MSSDIISEFLLQSPPNEFQQILKGIFKHFTLPNYDNFIYWDEILDLDTIIDGCGNVYHDGSLKAAAIQRHWENFPLIKLINNSAEDGEMLEKSCLLSKYNILGKDENSYYDAINRLSFNFDPLRLNVDKVEALEPLIPFEENLNQEIEKYVTESFPNGAWGVYPISIEANDSQEPNWMILIVGSKADSKNFWAAQWSSLWKWDKEHLEGEIKVFVHYQEDGNIQLNTSRKVLLQLQGDVKPNEVIAKIKAAEDSVQLALNEIYHKLSMTTFRRLRRQLPITRMKMDWSKIEAFGLGSELASKSKLP